MAETIHWHTPKNLVTSGPEFERAQRAIAIVRELTQDGARAPFELYRSAEPAAMQLLRVATGVFQADPGDTTPGLFGPTPGNLHGAHYNMYKASQGGVAFTTGLVNSLTDIQLTGAIVEALALARITLLHMSFDMFRRRRPAEFLPGGRDRYALRTAIADYAKADHEAVTVVGDRLAVAAVIGVAGLAPSSPQFTQRQIGEIQARRLGALAPGLV